MGLINGYRGEHPLTLLGSKVACMEFLSYAWMYAWELSHVFQVNWNPSGGMNMVLTMKPFGQFCEGIKVHGERCTEIVGCVPPSVDTKLQSLEEPHRFVFGNTGYKPNAAKCSELLQ